MSEVFRTDILSAIVYLNNFIIDCTLGPTVPLDLDLSPAPMLWVLGFGTTDKYITNLSMKYTLLQ